MDTRDRKNQEIAAEGFMAPDADMSPAQFDPDLALLTDNTLATTLGENELKDLQEKQKKPTTPFQDSMRRLRRDKRAMACVGIIGFFVLLAIFGPLIYQHIGGIYQSPISGPVGPQVYHTYYHQELDRQDELPSLQYWLGTDQLGRDQLARLMQGILISITVALLVEVVDVGVGITVGVLAGFHGGAIDQVLARFTDIIFAFPGLLFIIVVVASTLNIVGTIIGEAGISLLGLGVQPPGSSIGLMISKAQNVIDSHPFEILLPTAVLTILVMAFSFLGDGLRDAFDPRSKD